MSDDSERPRVYITVPGVESLNSVVTWLRVLDARQGYSRTFEVDADTFTVDQVAALLELVSLGARVSVSPQPDVEYMDEAEAEEWWVRSRRE